MSLQLVNNNYVGALINDFATLVTIGSIDTSLFHTLLTNGSKVRFPYLDVTTDIQTFTSICAVTDSGNRSRELIDVNLIRFIFQEEACYDEEFTTDYADAAGGYASQKPDPAQIGEWGRLHVDNFSTGLQSVRWSGDTGSANPLLANHDGVVKLIQAKGAYVAVTNETGYQKITTTVVTAANCIQEIGKVVDALPLEVKAEPGFKIVCSPQVVNFLQQQLRNSQLTVGLNALPVVKFNPLTGQVTDGSFFGAPVFVAYGLAATAANQNVIMAGVFEGTRKGVLKWGANKVQEEKTLTLREVKDGDAVRMRIIAGQNVSIIPNVSQVAMNI